MTRNDSWRKSSYSGGEGGNCIELTDQDQAVLVRDSKQADIGPVLRFTPTAWRTFTGKLKGC